MIIMAFLVGWILWKGHESFSDFGLAALEDDSSCLSTPTSATTNSASSRSSRVFVLSQEAFPQVEDDLSAQLNLANFEEQDLLQMEPSSVPPFALVVDQYEFGSTVKDYSIALQSVDIPRRRKRSKRSPILRTTKPFLIDFYPESSTRLFQRVQGGSGGDLLVKAVSPSPEDHIWDLTAGLGQDAFLLAVAGARHVSMVERNPVVATLLEDALRRLRVLSEQSEDNVTRAKTRDLSNRLSLQHSDGIDVARKLHHSNVASTDEAPDIVYLDPMFPTRKKTASVKKSMQLLHGILKSQDTDENTRLEDEMSLLRLSLDVARRKVVVKRPIHAPLLGQGKWMTSKTESPFPSYDIRGSINRWDVYVCNKDR